MKCPICETEINEPLQQFGKPRLPICQSCFLNGEEWIYNDPYIVAELQRGTSIKEALTIARQEGISDLEAFAREFFKDFIA